MHLTSTGIMKGKKVHCEFCVTGSVAETAGTARIPVFYGSYTVGTSVCPAGTRERIQRRAYRHQLRRPRLSGYVVFAYLHSSAVDTNRCVLFVPLLFVCTACCLFAPQVGIRRCLFFRVFFGGGAVTHRPLFSHWK